MQYCNVCIVTAQKPELNSFGKSAQQKLLGINVKAWEEERGKQNLFQSSPGLV